MNNENFSRASGLLKKHNQHKAVHFTKDGQAFFVMNHAENHARNIGQKLDDIETITRDQVTLAELKSGTSTPQGTPAAAEVVTPEVKEPEVKEPEVKEPEVKEPEVKEPNGKKGGK